MDSIVSSPVAQLIKFGEARFGHWADYTNLGLTSEHIPELLRIAGDSSFDFLDGGDPRVYAPVHAWRALAELQAPEVVPVLLARLDSRELNDDWVTEDFVEVVRSVGPDSLSAIFDFLNDPTRYSPSQYSATSAIAALGDMYPQNRQRIIDELTTRLRNWDSNSPELNGGLIDALTFLRVPEAMPLIRTVMEAGAADMWITGSIEDIEDSIGLSSQPPGRRIPRGGVPGLPQLVRSPDGITIYTESDARSRSNAKERARARRKQAKASKKRNRRR